MLLHPGPYYSPNLNRDVEDDHDDVIPIERHGNINDHPLTEEPSSHVHDIYINISHPTEIELQGEQTRKQCSMNIEQVTSESSHARILEDATVATSASAVMLPSSFLHHPYFLAFTYLLLLIMSLIISITTSYYLILITPLLTFTLVGVGMMIWLSPINSQQWDMSHTQFIHLIWCRFTFAFWSIGIVAMILILVESLLMWWLFSRAFQFPLKMSGSSDDGSDAIALGGFILIITCIAGIICLPYGLVVYPYLIRSTSRTENVTPSQLELDVIIAKSMSMGITSATIIFSFHILTLIMHLSMSSSIQDMKRVVMNDGIDAVIPVLVAFVILTIKLLCFDCIYAEYLIARNALRVVRHHPVSHLIRRFVITMLFRGLTFFGLLLWLMMVWNVWMICVIIILYICILYSFFLAMHKETQKCCQKLDECAQRALNTVEAEEQQQRQDSDRDRDRNWEIK